MTRREPATVGRDRATDGAAPPPRPTLVAALRSAAIRAAAAPSVLDTQPWRLRVEDDTLRLFADRDRQLHVADPTGRQLLISCGAALFHARASLLADGYAVETRCWPQGGARDELARLHAVARDEDDAAGTVDARAAAQMRRLVAAMDARYLHLTTVPEPADPALRTLLADARRAASVEGVGLVEVRRPAVVARLTDQALALVASDPSWRAERRGWGAPDPTTHHSPVPRCVVALCTDRDRREDWLATGEAFARVVLTLAAAGIAAAPLIDVVQPAATRARLRAELGIAGWPHIMLAVGTAPRASSQPRRRLVDVLDETL